MAGEVPKKWRALWSEMVRKYTKVGGPETFLFWKGKKFAGTAQ